MNFKEYLSRIDESLFPKSQETNKIGIPIVSKNSKIIILDEKGKLSSTKSPIFIQLEDGTKIYMTRNQFDRISGDKPEIGKTLKISFQRNLLDKRPIHSQIDSIYCF